MEYIITAGGTGGHIYPAMTLANKLTSQGHKVTFVASKNGIDKSIFSRKSDITYKVVYEDLRGFNRDKNISTMFFNFLNCFKLLYILVKYIFKLRNKRYKAVIGFGGYITFPIVYAAKVKGIKTFIHEQNSYPGLVNRKLSSKVDVVFYTYESSTKYFPKAKKLLFTSNPRVDEVKDIKENYTGEINTTDTILFIGGSLGAEKINDIAIQFAIANKEYKVTLVCGSRYISEINSKPVNLRLVDYLTNPIEDFLTNDFVITRAGATTLVELVVSMSKSIVVPSPNVTADHQTKNALEFEKLGFIEFIPENELTVSRINDKIENWNHNYLKVEDKMGSFVNFNVVNLMLKEINGESN